MIIPNIGHQLYYESHCSSEYHLRYSWYLLHSHISVINDHAICSSIHGEFGLSSMTSMNNMDTMLWPNSATNIRNTCRGVNYNQ